MADWIGYKWLEARYQVEAVQPFVISSCIGRSRTFATNDGFSVETYTEASRPESTLAAHL